MDWQGKTVIVTGGAQGIGMAVTRLFLFARAGAHVAVSDSDPEAGIEIQQAKREEEYSVTAHACDVSGACHDRKQAQSKPHTITHRFSPGVVPIK